MKIITAVLLLIALTSCKSTQTKSESESIANSIANQINNPSSQNRNTQDKEIKATTCLDLYIKQLKKIQKSIDVPTECALELLDEKSKPGAISSALTVQLIPELAPAISFTKSDIGKDIFTSTTSTAKELSTQDISNCIGLIKGAYSGMGRILEDVFDLLSDRYPSLDISTLSDIIVEGDKNLSYLHEDGTLYDLSEIIQHVLTKLE
ncbi:hypothetical protein P4E94_18990 [Pontiellaceae bacterium B12219]|nr:hypothetical protein [Pontiellaceae bacterium B12219]